MRIIIILVLIFFASGATRKLMLKKISCLISGFLQSAILSPYLIYTGYTFDVCEYFHMMQYFHELGITKHNEILYEMGIKEKEHEIYFLSKIKNKKILPFFEKVFGWGTSKIFNDVDLDKKYPINHSELYCKK